MKRIYLFIIAGLMLASCSESFLDTEPLTKKTDVAFYKTPADAQLALTAAYSSLTSMNYVGTKTTYKAITSSSNYIVSEVMSDDRFGGGGENDRDMIAIDYFEVDNPNQYQTTWARYYEGIFRANMLIQKLDQIVWDNDAQRGDVEGQIRYLRANFYMDLARMFGQVPLITETAPLNIPKSSPDSIWAQIATDLKIAIESFPSTKATELPLSNFGRATKWAAEGLMARAFLFYTGYYNKTEMPLVEGGSITKQQVITWIDDCAANSGHKLMPEFRNLWPYSYSNTDYNYARDNNLNWYGEDGENLESVWAYSFSNLASWSSSIYYSNQYVLYQGIRAQNLLPFGTGWGVGTVNPELWESWDDNDIRKRGSIYYVNDPGEDVFGLDLATGNHVPYAWSADKQMHETGYWSKKYMPITVRDPKNKNRVVTYSVEKYGVKEDFQLAHTQDQVIIRFSDILLMGAELGGSNAQSYLDQVRSRVGLPSVPATLENIKTERRHELAFEGVRYYDLLRWHDETEAFGKIKNIPVIDAGKNTTHTTAFRPETGGFLPIPNAQIILSNGALKQNPGWDVPEAIYKPR
jgi:hypothetical protein